MRQEENAVRFSLVFAPVLVFFVGCFVDIALNSVLSGPRVSMFLPEVCGLTVGALTVLTFARRRDAYLVAGAVYAVVEMLAVTAPMDVPMRIAVCVACLAVAVICLTVYVRVPWATVQTIPTQQRD